MRLLVDEDIQQPTIEFLRQIGHDARGIKEEGLATRSDEIIFERAQQSQRVLLTYNVDFTDIRELAGKHHYGAIRLRITNQRLLYLHPILERVLKDISSVELNDTLVTVSDNRVRVRNTYTV